MISARWLLVAAALAIGLGTPMAAGAAPPLPTTTVTVLAARAGDSGSAIGPGGALYVTQGSTGEILRIDPKTGAVTTFASGLPRQVETGLGGAIDVAFIGSTAYVLVTLVGSDIGGSSVVGIYRVDGPSTFTVIADIGAFSVRNPPPPSIEIFVPTGVQYALEAHRGGFLVTDGHHNRVLQVAPDGTVTEVIQLANIVPTGLEVIGNTVFLAQAGPVPHLPATGKVVSFGAGLKAKDGRSPVTEIASGGRLLVDVERGRGGTLFALTQGDGEVGAPDGSPAVPRTGALLRIDGDGGFTVVVGGLDRPTSLEIDGDTAYVVTLGGTILRVDGVLGSPPHGKAG